MVGRAAGCKGTARAENALAARSIPKKLLPPALNWRTGRTRSFNRDTNRHKHETVNEPAKPVDDPIHRELEALPRPRKHYQWYYSTREANNDMQHATQGEHDFLRA